jgi:predicted nucleic acid-binding protein
MAVCYRGNTHFRHLELQLALLSFLSGERCVMHDFAAADLHRFMAWMRKYRDRPMDFADASLLWLAIETGVADILTTDRADFETYRLPGGTRFRIL